MHRITNLRYLISDVPKNAGKTASKAVKPNIKPIKIDFPLPDSVKGIENRLNSKNTFSIPEVYGLKNKPEAVIGKNVRLSYLLEHQDEYVDKVITVTGWAR